MDEQYHLQRRQEDLDRLTASKFLERDDVTREVLLTLWRIEQVLLGGAPMNDRTYSDQFRELNERLSRIETNQDRILYKLAVLFEIQRKAKGELETLMIDTTQLEAKVTAAETVEASAVTLIQGISQQLKDLAAQVANEPAVQQKINDMAAGLDASTTPLATAVTANTPAAPTA